MEKQLDVTILMPCFNEEEALPSIIKEIREVMAATTYSYEILIVDDKSTDKSPQIAKEMGCRLIQHVFNRGAGACRKTGTLAAKSNIIVMLDADGTYPVKSIPDMLPYFPKYDQVNGARRTEEGTLRLLRIPMKWFIRKLACFLASYNIPDLNTGLKAFKRDVMLNYLWTVPDGFSCVSSMTLAFLCNGHPVKYIPIDYFKRIGKSKFHPLRDTSKYLLTVLRVVMYFNPLKVFLPLSIGLLVFGISKSFYDFFFVLGRLQLSDIIIVISGLVVGSQGLLADLIVAQSRIHLYKGKK
ncbi:glycosyltransferase family 2 protein [Candidatus Omnitrophota bacterium]